jgi:hypothetical protein
MMARSLWTAALALGAVFALGDFARADDGPAPSGLSGGVITLGGQGTIADAATANDVEQTCHRRYYGYGYGYSPAYYGGGYYGGYGYGGYGYSTVAYSGGYYGGYYGGYRPGYYGGLRPIYHAGLRPGFGYQSGYYRRVDADSDDVSAPAVYLNGTTSQPVPEPTTPYKFKAYGEK